MKWKYAAMMLGACALGVVSASASPIGLSGNFSSKGRGVINQFACSTPPCPGSIVWTSDQPGNAPDMFTLSGSNNLFLNGNPLNENGQNVIHDLNNPPQVVGTTFGLFDFIDFTAGPAAPSLMANFVSLGDFASTGCPFATSAPAPGQPCTLPGSPFAFTNSSSSTSSVTFNVSGVTRSE